MRRIDPTHCLVRACGLAVCVTLAVACGGAGGDGEVYGGYGLLNLASVTPTAELAASTSGSGQFAADFLRRTSFTNLVVEIDYPVGHPPAVGVAQLLEERLAERCDKPDGVTVVLDDAIPLAEIPPILGVADLDELESAYRDMYADVTSQTAVMYVLYVTGNSDLDGATTEVVGLSYHGSSIALFLEAADQGTNPLVTTAEVQGATIVHEMGHQLGLVNAGVPMAAPHADSVHGAHDIERSCTMYWLISVPQGAPNLADPGFAQFDPNCVADLQAAGGLGPLPARIATQTLDGPSESVVVGTCGGCLGRVRSIVPARR